MEAKVNIWYPGGFYCVEISHFINVARGDSGTFTNADEIYGMQKQKNIAIVAHDNRKADMLEWVEWNYTLLSRHQLICTGTTGTKIEQILGRLASAKSPAPPVVKLKSGPLGGDQQLGAKIADGEIDVLIFFWDPMEPHPHDVDVKALLRIAVVYNIPIACNRSSADFIISSPLIEMEYAPKLKDYSTYLERNV